ncbi:hypothetical protein MMC25_000577 [Agyrium rufum]|nr:hypothetical protein [Agyrium rufum]
MSSSPPSSLSSLSPAPSEISDDEVISNAVRGGRNIDQYFKKRDPPSSPPPQKKKRPASPPHEFVLADNPSIAFIVMFRSRFSAAFPKSLPNYGPQDIERGVAEAFPDEQVEKLLCSLLGLVLNRKKDIERGHHSRALEEAVQTHNNQWPVAWKGKNPLHGGKNFNNMTPEERLTLLKTLMLWSLNSSDAVSSIMKESYKQSRHEDDLNQPLSVQSWGRDGDKRRYWLIEGQDDTHFRLYRESNPALKHNTWWSVAGSIEELQIMADRLEEEGSQASRRLRERILGGIPRFEASDEKRKRRDYRLSRKAQFTRPELGFSLYEGRTRGKRIRYTFSDEDDEGASDGPNKRSARHSGVSTPAEPAGPTYTASGRQVKSRLGGAYGETMHSGQNHGSSGQEMESIVVNGTNGFGYDGNDDVNGNDSGTRTRSSRTRQAETDGYNDVDEMRDDESEASAGSRDWDAPDDDDEDNDDDDANADIGGDEEEGDVEMSDSGAEEDGGEGKSQSRRKRSLVVALRYHSKDSEVKEAGDMTDMPPLPVRVNGVGMSSGPDESMKDLKLESESNLTNGHGSTEVKAGLITMDTD